MCQYLNKILILWHLRDLPLLIQYNIFLPTAYKEHVKRIWFTYHLWTEHIWFLICLVTSLSPYAKYKFKYRLRLLFCTGHHTIILCKRHAALCPICRSGPRRRFNLLSHEYISSVKAVVLMIRTNSSLISCFQLSDSP